MHLSCLSLMLFASAEKWYGPYRGDHRGVHPTKYTLTGICQVTLASNHSLSVAQWSRRKPACRRRGARWLVGWAAALQRPSDERAGRVGCVVQECRAQ